MVSYLLQMIACSAVLYGYYHLFLRNERFHQYNRFYLLLAVAISLVLPLLKIPVEIQDTTSPVYLLAGNADAVTVTAIQNDANGNSRLLWYIVYALVALWFVSKLMLAVRRIIRIKQQANIETIEDIQFIKTKHPDSPFSFFRWLFWNEKIKLESTEGHQIFRHELYHIRSKHSWELLFTEIVLCVFWFNPVFYLYRKEIKTIQEFLADQHATADQDPSNYAEILLIHAINAHQTKLVSPFFHNQLKRRIAMLTSSKKTAHQWLRKLLALPVIAVSVALFAFTYKKEIKSILPDIASTYNEVKMPVKAPISLQKESIKTDTVPSHKNREVSANYSTGTGRYTKLNPVTIISYTDSEEPKTTLKDNAIKVDVDARYPGNWNNFLAQNIDGQIPTKAGAPAGNYEVLVRFTINEDGSLSNFEPVTNEGYGMENEVIQVLKKSDKWNPAVNNEHGGDPKPVKSYRIQPVNFQVQRKGLKEEEIFTKAEVDAKYPGNWFNFLSGNLNANIPLGNKAAPGNYTTVVQFIVDVAGNVSDVKALTNHGYGMEEEAMRVIKKSGLWAPAIQNGRVVKSFRKQPITFQVVDIKNNAEKTS